MKREIKFRGKRIDNGEWVYGNLINKIKPTEKEPTFWCSLIQDGALTATEVDPETVGQLTGLLDRNGKEIYEGDVIKGKSYLYGHQLKPDGKQFDYKGVVEFQTQCDVGLCWVVSDGSGSWNLNKTVHRNEIDYCTGVIIGNIFDDPELINEAN